MWLISQLDNTNDPYFESHEYKETKTINRNDLGQHPSRLGSEFLRDIISHFETLRWLPGGLYGPENEEVRPSCSTFSSFQCITGLNILDASRSWSSHGNKC